MKITRIGNQVLWRVLTAVFLLLLVIGIAGMAVTTEWSGYINQVLNVQSTTIVTDENDDTDVVYFKSGFSKHTDVMNNARSVAQKVQKEGSVLMKNDGNALPLAKNSKVTLFSYSTVDPVYGSSGSGGVSVGEERKIDFIDAFQGKLDVNMTLYNWYKEQFAAGVKVTPESSNPFSGEIIPAQITREDDNGFVASELNAETFPSEVKESFSEYKDAAIFVMSRIGGEGSDLIDGPVNEDSEKYLALNDDERSVLQAMKDGNFSKRIVLLNTFNAVELDWLDEYNIDAVLYIGGPGEAGLTSVADILVGDANPSGRLADTYAADSFSSPAMQNFGNFTYGNASSLTDHDGNFSNATHYLMYLEGIYVGYRYYETRYEDVVLGKGNADSDVGAYASKDGWSYAEEVSFPFGHGLSYTTFTQTLKDVKVDEEGKSATVTVTVANAANGKAGKDVVQIYAQAPYAEGVEEKSAVVLAGFFKTEELVPGESKEYSYTIDLRDIATYDYEENETYILDEGDYYFAIGSDAHDALNNILALKADNGVNVNEAAMTDDGDEAKARMWTKTEFRAEEYSASKADPSFKVTNRFESADINYYLDGSDEVTYLSRSAWDTTWPETMTNFTATTEMINELNGYYGGSDNSPSAYELGSTDTSSFTYGSEKTAYNVVMMKGQAYDDPAWEDLLDQITLDEYAASSRQGRSAIKSINLNASTAVDGPAAWTKSYYKEDYDDYSEDAKKTTDKMVLYPIETVVACTWNTELAEELGVSFGEEGLWGGGVGWYGPAANIHRTPYAGRNFEYYSEDGFLSGKLGEAEVHGAMSKGVIPYFKHFFLNDQETNRIGVCTFSNEQAIREIYLRAFQYAFETTGEDDPACTGVMGGFNRLGLVWTGHHSDLWKNVMEGEWGFTGNVTTDFGQNPSGLMDPSLAYEAGTTMFCTSGGSFETILLAKMPKDAKLAENVREAVHRNLYNFANNLAMNGMASSSRIVPIMTWYQKALTAWIVVSAVVTAGSAVMLALHMIFAKKEEKENAAY